MSRRTTRPRPRSTSEPAHFYRAANAELIRSRDPEFVLSGPAGTGKSLACLHKLHACALKYPGMRGLIVRKTRAALTETVLVTFEDRLLSPYWFSRLAANCQRYQRHSYIYPNGSEIVVGGLDKPSKVMSSDYDVIYTNEMIEFSEGDVESLSSRLRPGAMPYQQLIGDTNPDAQTHWLRRRADSGGIRMEESRHRDNPLFWDSDKGEWTPAGVTYLARLARLTGVRKLRLNDGLWVGAEGIVYDEWDEKVHRIGRMPDGWHGWRKIRSIDFGFTNPFSCSWWAIDGDGRMYRYRQIYFTGRTVRAHAAQIKRLSGDERYEATVSDHDAEDRATLEECGICTAPASKEVKPGIEAVKERMKLAGDGKPRIYFLKDSLAERDPALIEAGKPTCTEEEIPGYVWLPAKDGQSAKEEPKKVDDHGLDETRYAVCCVDGVGGPGRQKVYRWGQRS